MLGRGPLVTLKILASWAWKRSAEKSAVERRQVKIGHKVHNTYDATLWLPVVKWLLLALPRRFTLHEQRPQSRFGR